MLMKLLQTEMPPHRVDHGPVQRIGEELRPGRGDLLDKALYVLAFLLCVDATFGPWDFRPIQPQALVVIAVVQRDKFPLARLLVGLLVVELVEDTFPGRQLLPLSHAELAGTVGGTWRRETLVRCTRRSGTLRVLGIATVRTQFKTKNLGPMLLQGLDLGGVFAGNDDAAGGIVARRVGSRVPAGGGHGWSSGDDGFELRLGLL